MMSPEWPRSWDGTSTCNLALLGGEELCAIWTPPQAASPPQCFPIQSLPLTLLGWGQAPGLLHSIPIPAASSNPSVASPQGCRVHGCGHTQQEPREPIWQRQRPSRSFPGTS